MLKFIDFVIATNTEFKKVFYFFHHQESNAREILESISKLNAIQQPGEKDFCCKCIEEAEL